MERPRALARRTCAFFLGAIFVPALGSAACAPKIEELSKQRSERDSLGQEVYKVLCRRVAGTEIPGDSDGRRTETLCLGDAESAADELEEKRAQLPPRLVALAERRAVIADALDEGLPDDTGSGLEELMRELLPFYDPPEEVLQEGTRRTAAVLKRLAADDAALEALERFGREGMLSGDADFGALRGILSYSRIGDVLREVLVPLSGEDLAPAFQSTLAGLAFELASSEVEDDPSSNTCRTRDLMQRTEPLRVGEPPRFASGRPLYSAMRDVRGMPVPKRVDDAGSADVVSACAATPGEARPLPYPFVDLDKDGLADVDGPSFRLQSGFEGPLPEPFPVTGEVDLARDGFGRAHALGQDGKVDTARPLYLTRDSDATLLAASLRESARAFASDRSMLRNVAIALPALIGPSRETSRRYGKAEHTYQAPDPDQSPLIAMVHAADSMISSDSTYDEAAELGLTLMREHEQALMTSFEPLLALERRTRPGADAYPSAKLEPGNTLWDEMLFEGEKLSRRRNSANGETLLEGTVRATLGYGRNFAKPGAPRERLIDPRLLAQQGAILAMMMRFKDEWRGNPVARSERAPGDPAIIGMLTTPVDHTKADTPITCGKDGCGGQVAGTPFERWQVPGKACMIPAEGRPANAKDCGKPANQSLFHRSMGMLAELEGRSQCNRPITVRDLFKFAADKEGSDDEAKLESTIDQAERDLASAYTCPSASVRPNAPCRAYAAKFPSAFVPRRDARGPLPPAIQECALLDLPDAGRTFGRVLTREYQLEIPNPWVRRYLEDVARAADFGIPVCLDVVIEDPTVAPPCIPAAARTSRSAFTELRACEPKESNCVDTVHELIEFLLDDDQLFQTERDGLELRPDARTLSRVMFTPAGASDGFKLFDALLVRGAPPVCTAVDTRPVCPEDDSNTANDERCCISDINKAPLRFRLDTYYSGTTFAWEHMFKFKNGKELSFFDATSSIADAFNRLDIPAGADPADFEEQGYLLTRLGSIVSSHYDSPQNSAVQNKDPNKPGFRRLSGLVRYEELLADLIDDGSLDLTQKAPHGAAMFDPKLSFTPDQQLGLLSKSVDLLLALEGVSIRGGDGISALARSTEGLLNPHAFCAGERGDRRVIRGRGACDSAGRVRAPIATLGGRNYPCWQDGTCFDGKTTGVPKRFVSSASLLLDAVRDFDARSEQDPDMDEAARKVVSDVIDLYASIEDGRLKDRRLRAVALVTGDYLRERWAQDKANGTLESLGEQNTEDMIDLLTNPAVAGGLDLLRGLMLEPGALESLSGLLHALLDETSEPAASRAFLGFAADALQSLPGDASQTALLRAGSFALAPNIDEVLAGRQERLDLDGSLLWNNVFTLAESTKADHADVLGSVSRAMVGAGPAAGGREGPVPAVALYDALLDINRVDASAHGPHSAEDYRSAFTRIADVLLDEHRGFERLYQLVRCSRHPEHESCD